MTEEVNGMLEGIPIGIATVGPWGLVVLLCSLVVLGFVRGDIVPRKTAQMFYDAWQTEKAANDAGREQQRVTLELAQTTVQLLEGIKATASGEPDKHHREGDGP